MSKQLRVRDSSQSKNGGGGDANLKHMGQISKWELILQSHK